MVSQLSTTTKMIDPDVDVKLSYSVFIMGMYGMALLLSLWWLPDVNATPAPVSAIAQWPSGRYQFCSQPEPKDWKDGAGVCVVFTKTGAQMDGYYGYPHSDRFICLRGSLTNEQFKGEGLAFTWFSSSTPNVASLEKQWDAEGRIEVDQAQILKLEPAEDGWGSWVRFRATTLDLKGLYRYSAPKMRPASELCSW